VRVRAHYVLSIGFALVLILMVLFYVVYPYDKDLKSNE